MTRYALKIEYHGARFFGWQRQKTHPSVQQTVEEALAKIEPVPVIIEGAGRTEHGRACLGAGRPLRFAKGLDEREIMRRHELSFTPVSRCYQGRRAGSGRLPRAVQCD